MVLKGAAQTVTSAPAIMMPANSPATMLMMIPTGAKVIDVGTATLLPGLIDVHTHLMARIREGNQVENYTLQLATKSGAYRALEGAADAHLTLQAGFTTVRDVESEGSGYADVALRTAIERGLIEGPRMQVATRAIAATGGYFPERLRKIFRYERRDLSVLPD